jgi:hypothetical protein
MGGWARLNSGKKGTELNGDNSGAVGAVVKRRKQWKTKARREESKRNRKEKEGKQRGKEEEGKKFHPSSLKQPHKAEKRPHNEVERLLLERRRSFTLYKESFTLCSVLEHS